MRDVVCKVILYGRDLKKYVWFGFVLFCFVLFLFLFLFCLVLFGFVFILLKPCDNARLLLKRKIFFCFSSKYGVTLKLILLKLSQITSLEKKIIRLLRSLLSYKTCTKIFAILYLIRGLSHKYVNVRLFGIPVLFLGADRYPYDSYKIMTIIFEYTCQIRVSKNCAIILLWEKVCSNPRKKKK